MYPNYYCDSSFNFDIKQLQNALKIVDSKVARQSPAGVRDLQAICLNQIPNDPNSITGGNVRGLYWTRPDSSGVEVQREQPIPETKYNQFVDIFTDTYFKYVYDTITTKYKLGRVRLLWKSPRTTLSWHRDPERRLHIPIVTNPGAIFIVDEQAKHLPADGNVWITDNTKYHSTFNGGEEERVHLVATVLE